MIDLLIVTADISSAWKGHTYGRMDKSADFEYTRLIALFNMEYVRILGAALSFQ